MDYLKCSVETTDSKIVLKEKRSKFIINNPKRKAFVKIEVDGCLITDNREKCDWIVEWTDPEQKATFVELKGCGVEKAVSQLKSTLQHTKHKFTGHKKECYAVTTRNPKSSSDLQKLRRKFFNETDATLQFKNLTFEVDAK